MGKILLVIAFAICSGRNESVGNLSLYKPMNRLVDAHAVCVGVLVCFFRFSYHRNVGQEIVHALRWWGVRQEWV